MILTEAQTPTGFSQSIYFFIQYSSAYGKHEICSFQFAECLLFNLSEKKGAADGL